MEPGECQFCLLYLENDLQPTKFRIYSKVDFESSNLNKEGVRIEAEFPEESRLGNHD